MKVILTFILSAVVTLTLIAQPTAFEFVDSDISALFLGNAKINETAAEDGDWIAAFDSDGNCVGANPIIFSGSFAYFSLSIKGDDTNTSSIDEGMQDGELFSIKIWDNSLSNIISYPDNSSPEFFTGWANLNGSPIADYSDPADVYNFTNFFNIGCTFLSSPMNEAINIETEGFLQWFEVPNATGYKLSVGDSSGVYNFINEYNIGASTSVYIDSFECATTYFVKITPFNDEGEQLNCNEEHFSTIFNIADAGENITICAGTEIQLNGSGGSIYSWSPTLGLSDSTIYNPIASPIVSTDYVLTANHPNGCSDTDTITITVLPTPLPNLTITNETSQGANNGSAFSSPTGAESPYSFLWSDGSTNSSITNLAPGSYAVTVSSINQCVSIEEFEILGYNCQEFNVIAAANPVSCHDDCDGSIIILNIQNGTEPYTYLWNNGETNDTIIDLCPGEYQLTITDMEGCLSEKSYTINNPDELFANVSTVAESTENGNNGFAFSAPMGGTEPFLYLWSNGEKTSLIDSLTPGHYSLYLEDFAGCTDTVIATVNQYGCDNLKVFTTAYITLCDGICDGSISIDLITGGTEPYSYNWSNGDTTDMQTDLCVGVYLLTVTDADSCNSYSIITIDEPEPLQSNLDISNESGDNANNGMATSSPTGGQGPYIYRWSTVEFTPTIQNLEPGDYQLSLSDANNCTIIDSFKIEAFICPQLVLNKNFKNIICNGSCSGSISYDITSGTAPYFYEWNTGQMTNNLLHLCADTYIVTITDSNNCSIVDTSVVTEPPAINFELAVNDETGNLTHDGSIIPTVSGGILPYHFEWNTGDTSTSLNNLIPGVYGLTFTDDRGCETINDNIVINAFECKGIEIEYFVEDVRCSEVCEGTITITSISEGTFPFTYAWSTGESSNNINGKCGGNYSLTITDVNECIFSQTFTIEEPDAFFVVFESMDEHKGQSDAYIHATIVGGTSPYQQEWNTGATSLNIDNIQEGNYQITVTDANGCTIVKSIDLEAHDCSLLTIESDYESNKCHNSADSYINITINGGLEPYQVNWSNGITNKTSLSSLPQGEYSVTVTDDFGCSTTSSYNISTPEELHITLDDLIHITDTSAVGTINTSISGGTLPYQYLWTTSDGYSAGTEDITDLLSNCYHLEIIDNNQCTTSIDVCIADLRTSTENYEALSSLVNVYPNPSKGLLNISIQNKNTKNISAMLLDIRGLKVEVYNNIGPEYNLDLSKQQNGIYFLQLNIDGEIIYRKIYIEK